MLEFVKDSIQLSNFLLLGLIALAISTYYYSLKRTRWFWVVYVVLFLAASTKFVPSKLLANYEAKTHVLDPNTLDKEQIYYIHVLGAGYSLDKRLPATSQLSVYALARLVEGIRISKKLPQYKIVTSGNSRVGLESQASVARRAAIELGSSAENCEILSTPTNTSEEVKAFVAKFGTNKKVIVVSTAIHLPRVLMLYRKHGIEAIGAPTNFKVKLGVNDSRGFKFPSSESINLMNDYLRERLKYLKDDF